MNILFMGMAADAALGGLQLPSVIEKACFAHFCAANIATSGYPFLTAGNASLIAAHGSAAQVEAMSEKDLGKRIKLLEKQMLEHARNLEFEKAARVRDQLALLREQAFGAAGHDVNVVPLTPKAGGR